MPKLTRRTKILYILAGCSLALICIGRLERLLVIDMCDNKIISQHMSSDGELKAVLFTRDCGATTATSYQVSVLNSWDSLSDADKGNVFVSYASPSLGWKGSRSLLITRKSANERIFLEQKEITVWPLFKNVKIEYLDR